MEGGGGVGVCCGMHVIVFGRCGSGLGRLRVLRAQARKHRTQTQSCGLPLQPATAANHRCQSRRQPLQLIAAARAANCWSQPLLPTMAPELPTPAPTRAEVAVQIVEVGDEILPRPQRDGDAHLRRGWGANSA